MTNVSMPLGQHLLEVLSLEGRNGVHGQLLVANFRTTRRGKFAEMSYVWNLSGAGQYVATVQIRSFLDAIAVAQPTTPTAFDPETVVGRVVVANVVEKAARARPDVKFWMPVWSAPSCEEVLVAVRDSDAVRRRYVLEEPHLVALDAVYEERWDLVAAVCVRVTAPVARDVAP